jgi:hypothetical protein
LSSPTPSASPSPSALPDYGAPPAGVDLLYAQVPGWPSWLIGYDWQGQPRATVHLKELDSAANIPFGITVAPNGGGFTGGEYTFDRLGNAVYQYPITGKGFAVNTFSEDGALLCGVNEAATATDSNGSGTMDFYLMRRIPTGPPVTVVRFLHLNAIPGDMGYHLFACSHWLDRALAIRTVCCGVTGATTIQISDGTILGTWERDAGSPVFSPDGQLVADPVVDSSGNTLSTVVSTVLGGVVIARYGPGVTFRAFSSNNRYAVVLAAGSGGPVAQVVQVNSRRVVWSDSSSRGINAVWSRPGTGDMAIAFTASPAQVPCNSSAPCTNPESNVVIVHSDGSSVALSGNVLAQFLPWA